MIRRLALLALSGLLLADAPFDSPGKREPAAPFSIKVDGATALSIDNVGNFSYTTPATVTQNGNGLTVTITGGAANGTGVGGAISFTAGSSTASAGTGGTITLQGGAQSSGFGNGGPAIVAGGDVTGGSAPTGGAVTIRGGNTLGAGTGGLTTIEGGSANNSGGVTITTQGGSSTFGSSGTVAISTGNEGGTAGQPGSITVTTGNNGANNNPGGDMTFTTGTGSRRGQMHFAGQTNTSVTTLAIATATFTPDGTNNNYSMTLVHASCPCTLANPTQTPVAGTTGQIVVIQSATGSDTIGTWGSQYEAPGGTATLTLSSGANAVDILTYYVRDSSHIELTLQKNFSH